MQSTTWVALDAMGGDNAPAEVVKGAVDAVNKRNDIKIFLVGQKIPVERELSLYTYPKEQIEIVDAPEVIEMAEPPVVAIRRKKQSSIVIGMNMVKNKEADAFVSAGSSGAVLVGGQVIVGRIKGIQRPPLHSLPDKERENRIREAISRQEKFLKLTQAKINQIDRVLSSIDNPLKSTIKDIFLKGETLTAHSNNYNLSNVGLYKKINKAIEKAFLTTPYKK